MSSDPTAVTKLYEQIPLESMQQVSDSYLAWYVDRVTRQLDEHMAALRSELRENDAKEAGFRPSPNELSAIERLQRSGVTGVDLLDRMVEQGEDWLVVTMRRLDHFEKTGLAAWKSTFELNLFSAVEVTRAALPHLRKSAGCIVNIASDVGRRPFDMGPDYCASKAALINLTRYLAAELAPVRVNAVCPGPVVTGPWGDKAIRKAASRTLAGRTGTPEEVADAVLFAVKCGYLNGAVCGVDGGAVRTP